jgi:carbonic anhydrase
VITHSGPGDLFTVRNVGNLVPAHGADVSTEAALEFAVGELGVRSVVVCGHSGCGAMHALLSDDAPASGTGLDGWLAHARPSLDRYRAGHPVAVAAADAGYDEPARLSMVNVAVQLENLAAHPLVSRAMRERDLVLSGLYFDIATARVLSVTTSGIAEITDVDRAGIVEPH